MLAKAVANMADAKPVKSESANKINREQRNHFIDTSSLGESKPESGIKGKCNLNFSISSILNKESSLVHNLRDNLLSGE